MSVAMYQPLPTQSFNIHKARCSVYVSLSNMRVVVDNRVWSESQWTAVLPAYIAGSALDFRDIILLSQQTLAAINRSTSFILICLSTVQRWTQCQCRC